MNKIRIAIVLIFLLVMGVSLTVQGASDIIKLNGYVPDFNYDSVSDLKKGDFIQGYVCNIFDRYASETTTETTMGIETSSRTSEEYFLMPLINEADEDKDLFVTISASNIDDRRLLLDVRNDTWNYLSGDTDSDFTEMYIVARGKKKDNNLISLLVEWFIENEFFSTKAEAEQHIVPYEFVIYRNLKAPYISLAVGLVIIAGFAVAGVIIYKKMRPSHTADQNSGYTYTPADGGGNGNASGGGFAETVRPAVPIPDIPQPLQPDEFFARPERKTAAAEEPAQEEKTEPKPEPAPQEQAPAFVPGNMDDLDTSALSVDSLAYYDTPEDEDGYAEYEFSNDGDFADADADSIKLSD